jgi:3-oxoacyl-[acyl-carrier-protein] synthase-1
MTKPVHIVRVAARTPVGLSAPGTAAALRARLSRLSFHPFMVDPAGNPLRCGRDGELDPELSGVPRLAALAAAALGELFEEQVTRGTVPVLLALPEPRPGFDREDAADVLRQLGMGSYEGARELSVRATAAGHAGALRGLGEALSAIRAGQYQLCAVGGVDSYLDADALTWLDGQLLLARDGVRGGFPPGEAAAFVLLASDDALRALKLPSLAQLVGAEHAQEKRARDSDAGFLGEALAQAIRGATRGLKLPDEQVSDIFCDMNGERMRTDDWGFALLRTQRMFRAASEFVTGAPEYGDIGAASGAVSAALAVEAFQRGYARGPRALIWGASWSGLRAACVLQQVGS